MLRIVIMFSLFLGFSFPSLFSQSPYNYTKVDRYAKAYDGHGETVEEIAYGLTKSFSSQRDQARAIFVWIAEHIAYDCKSLYNRRVDHFYYSSPEEYEQKVAEIRLKQVKRTLSKRRGICDDYSTLFKHMSEAAGLEAAFIEGHARQYPAQIGKTPSQFDHAWNAIKIDGTWELLDVTWAAGMSNCSQREFLKRFSKGFFLTDPSLFILSHYPQNSEWQLLNPPISPKDLSQKPIVGYGFGECEVEDYFPKSAYLDAREGKAVFKIKTGRKIPPDEIFLFEDGHSQEFEVLEIDGYMQITYPLKGKRRKSITLAILENDLVLDVLTYKVR